MKITILNESYLQEKHLERLRKLGEVEVFSDTDSEEKMIEQLSGADIAVVDCFANPITKKVLAKTSRLKLIVLNSTGFDCVDLKALKEKGIMLANIPGYSTEAVAEHAIALMFCLVKKISFEDRLMKEHPFELRPDDPQCRSFLGFNLLEKTMGIIGLGRIGQRVGEIARGLGMKVIGFDKEKKNLPGIESVQLKNLLKESDIVSLHLPLTRETENLISKEELDLMKPGSMIINTARGGLVNTGDLYEALESGRIAGAGLDVLSDWSFKNPLLNLDNVVLTPHSAWFSVESLDAMAETITNTIEGFVNGNPINLVN